MTFLLPAPGAQFGISRFIRLLRIAECRLDILVPQALSDRRQTDPVIDQLCRVRVA